MSNYLPINVNLTGRPIVMVGGGRVALHKLKTLLKFTRQITIVAPQLLPQIKALKLKHIKARYQPLHLKKAFLVYACTDDPRVNRMVKQDAGRRGIMVNVADNKMLCDFISPAVLVKGGFTISVSSGGKNTKGAVALRDKIAEYLR